MVGRDNAATALLFLFIVEKYFSLLSRLVQDGELALWLVNTGMDLVGGSSVEFGGSGWLNQEDSSGQL